jgi:hypothetical protein
MKSFIESWIAAERDDYGNNQAQAIKALNEQLGTNLTHSRLSEYRRGIYEPSARANRYMLWCMLPWVLESAGVNVSDEQMGKIRVLLWGDEE